MNYHFHHLGIIKIVDDMLQDISVRHKPESSKDDHDWNLLTDVGQDSNDLLADGTLL